MAARRRPSPLSGEWLRLRWVRRGERGRLRAALLRPAGEGMAEWLGLRGEGRGGCFLYRADAGPATFTGPCSGRHRGLACRPKHGTDLVPGRHGHAACRARPCSGRASPCRATGRPAGRPEMDMYSHITTWQCKACTSSPCPIGPGEPGPRPGQSSLISTSCGPHH